MKKVRCYGYVQRPFAQVRALLRRDASGLFQRATKSAFHRSQTLVTTLHWDVAGIEVGVDVLAFVKATHDEEGVAGLQPITTIDIGWKAAHAPKLFPLMSARLSAWAIASAETQIELEGDYEPPLGMLGSAVDAIWLHRVAEAVVERFLQDVLAELRVAPAT